MIQKMSTSASAFSTSPLFFFHSKRKMSTVLNTPLPLSSLCSVSIESGRWKVRVSCELCSQGSNSPTGHKDGGLWTSACRDLHKFSSTQRVRSSCLCPAVSTLKDQLNRQINRPATDVSPTLCLNTLLRSTSSLISSQ